MSITVVQQVNEGIALDSSVGAPLGFGAEVSGLISRNYKEAVASTPIMSGVKAKVVAGNPHPVAILLNKVPTDTISLTVYELGVLDSTGEVIDLWVGKDKKGNTVLAFNAHSVRELVWDSSIEGIMSAFVFDPTDLDLLLEYLGTDFDSLESA